MFTYAITTYIRLIKTVEHHAKLCTTGTKKNLNSFNNRFTIARKAKTSQTSS